MDLTVETIQAAVKVAVIATHGEIDASNFLDLVEKVKQIYKSGVRDVLLDLTDTTFISSSGLVALHSIALLMRGKPALNTEDGWGALHAAEADIESGTQEHVKLLNPQPRVDRTLERTGLKQFFAIFNNREEALASYRPAGAQVGAQ